MHRKPGEILKALDELEAEVQRGMKELKATLESGWASALRVRLLVLNSHGCW